jgi:hypothetical protein
LAEAPSFGQTILRYDILSNGAQSYLALAEELMTGHGPTAADGGPSQQLEDIGE